MSDVASELHSMVLGIVNDLEAAVAGNLYEIDSNYVIIDDIDEWKENTYREKQIVFEKEHPDREAYDHDCYDSYEEWMEDEIGTVDDVDEPDEVSLSEYMEDQGLGDVRFEVDSSMDLNGGKALFTYGGPNIWVHDDEVCGYWGSERVEMSLDGDTRSALYGWFAEQWEIAKEQHGN